MPVSITYTPRQGQYLAFIHLYTRLHGRPPAEWEMAAYFRVSPPSVHGMVLTLERLRLIERVPTQARTIHVRIPPDEMPDLESGLPPSPRSTTFEVTYPRIARWVMDDGWVEIGRTEGSRSLSRVLDEGGLVWEGKDQYATVDDLLRDLEDGLREWKEEAG
jgi:hypothetical protein